MIVEETQTWTCIDPPGVFSVWSPFQAIDGPGRRDGGLSRNRAYPHRVLFSDWPENWGRRDADGDDWTEFSDVLDLRLPPKPKSKPLFFAIDATAGGSIVSSTLAVTIAHALQQDSMGSNGGPDCPCPVRCPATGGCQDPRVGGTDLEADPMRLPSGIIPAWIKQAIPHRREREQADLVDAAWKRYWEADRRRREQQEAETHSQPAFDALQNSKEER